MFRVGDEVGKSRFIPCNSATHELVAFDSILLQKIGTGNWIPDRHRRTFCAAVQVMAPISHTAFDIDGVRR